MALKVLRPGGSRKRLPGQIDILPLAKAFGLCEMSYRIDLSSEKVDGKGDHNDVETNHPEDEQTGRGGGNTFALGQNTQESLLKLDVNRDPASIIPTRKSRAKGRSIFS